jgi:two-component system response regulator YesN
MHRWLTNRIAYEELEERARLLGLPVDAPYYTVAICRSASSVALEQYVRAEFAVPHGDPIRLVVFRDLSGDVVLLFALPDASGRDTIVRLLERGADRATTPDVRIAVGGVRDGAEGAGASYAEASAAFPYFLVRPGQRVLRYETLKTNTAHDIPSYGLEWDRYTKLIHARSREELRDLIAADVRRLVAAEEATPSFVRQTVIDMMMQIRSEFRLAGPEDAGSMEEEYDRVRHAVDAEDLIESVVRVAGRAMDELERQTTTPVVKQVLQRIGRSYAEPLSLKSLALELHIHPVYLGQLFHQETGSTFTEYFNRYRVDKAKQLLVEGRHKVHEIAQMVGYPDTRYFYKKFKRYVGVSPMDYRDLQ